MLARSSEAVVADTVIPLIDLRAATHVPAVPEVLAAPTGKVVDRRGRALHDLRISVTDRCNFRCSYCMPKEVFDKQYRFMPQAELLSFEEITRLASLFVAHGVRKLRLTGGEPLLRRHIETLVGMLAALRTPDGEPLDLTLTTNGSLLARKAPALRAAGLNRVTVSLDALDDAVFRRMNDVDFPVAEVLHGIEAALEAGFAPVKVNMVVKRGVNDHEIEPMARYFRERHAGRAVLRFIEFMDVGSTNGWRMDEVVPSDEVLARLQRVHPLRPLQHAQPGETAQRWAWADGRGEVGLISSVTHAFCGDCNRARLSTEGRLYHCLFAHRGHDLRALLRGGASDEQLSAVIGALWQQRDDRYSELRASAEADELARLPRVEMHYIGG
jgi:cyclic pyranopterin phosphate synthase